LFCAAGLAVLAVALASLCGCVRAARPVTATSTWFVDCDNTIETRDNVTDNQGRLCSRDKLNYYTGCCDAAEAHQHDCSRCKANECCDRYEHCVSCCMGTDAVDTYMTEPGVFKVALHPETGHWENRWDYCTGQCRTTPLGTMYENSYKDDFKFCYSKFPAPELTLGKLPADLKVEMGLRGQSCTTACRAKGMTCAPEHFEKINFCEIIQEHTDFRCRFCKIKAMQEIAGPVVQYMAGQEFFDGTCIQERQMDHFSCDQDISELYNRICPCV